MASPDDSARVTDALDSDFVRDPLAVPEAVAAARQRPMSERLELALSWNSVAAELRAGLARGVLADVAPAEESLVDELLAERRRQAAREDDE
jgi:hypothetical protein